MCTFLCIDKAKFRTKFWQEIAILFFAGVIDPVFDVVVAVVGLYKTIIFFATGKQFYWNFDLI